MHRWLNSKLVIVAGVVIAGLLAAYSPTFGVQGSDQGSNAPALSIVESEGELVRGNGPQGSAVGLRSPLSKVLAVFGSPTDLDVNKQLGPGYLPAARPPIAFPGVDFSVGNVEGNSDLVTALIVYSTRSETSRGVAVGDPMEKARSRYRARCTPEYTVDYVTAAQCDVKIATGTYLTFVADFGSDDIGAIALSSEPRGGCQDGGAVRGAALRRCLREARRGPR